MAMRKVGPIAGDVRNRRSVGIASGTAILVIVALSACTRPPSEPGTVRTQEPLSLTLQVWWPRPNVTDTPEEVQRVVDRMEELSGVKLHIEYAPGNTREFSAESRYASFIAGLCTGKTDLGPPDIVLAPWFGAVTRVGGDWRTNSRSVAGEEEPMTMEWLCQNGYFRGLSESVRKWTPSLYSAIPEQFWHSIGLEDELYFLPGDMTIAYDDGIWLVRQDRAERLGLSAIATYCDLLAYLVQSFRETDAPYPLVGFAPGLTGLVHRAFGELTGLHVVPIGVLRNHPLRSSMLFATETRRAKVHTPVEDFSAEVRSVLQLSSALVECGLFEAATLAQPFRRTVDNRDVAMRLEEGEWIAAYLPGNAMYYLRNGSDRLFDAISTLFADPRIQVVDMLRETRRVTAAFGAYSRLYFPVAGDTENAMRYIEWLFSQEAFELTHLGIEGDHWYRVDDGRYEDLLETGSTFFADLSYFVRKFSLPYLPQFAMRHVDMPSRLLSLIEHRDVLYSTAKMDPTGGFEYQGALPENMISELREMVDALKRFYTGESRIDNDWSSFVDRYSASVHAISADIEKELTAHFEELSF